MNFPRCRPTVNVAIRPNRGAHVLGILDNLHFEKVLTYSIEIQISRCHIEPNSIDDDSKFSPSIILIHCLKGRSQSGH